MYLCNTFGKCYLAVKLITARLILFLKLLYIMLLWFLFNCDGHNDPTDFAYQQQIVY